MPGLLTLQIDRFHTEHYESAQELPSQVWDAMRRYELSANTILPQALKSTRRRSTSTSSIDRSGINRTSTSGSVGAINNNNNGGKAQSPNPKDSYLVLYNGSDTVEFVVALTQGQFGSYPVFILATVPYHLFLASPSSPHNANATTNVNSGTGLSADTTPSSSSSSTSSSFLRPRIQTLVDALYEIVPANRVFSIFAIDPVCHAFADAWTKRTGVTQLREPYYAATQTWCTRSTLSDHPETPVVGNEDYVCRLALPEDLEGVAGCCYEFADDSAPFTLTRDQSYAQAKKLIQNQEVYVLEVRPFNSTNAAAPSIGCIVASTRNTDRTATISKVYTPVQHRRKGCAQRLMRFACRDLLYRQRKECLVLYVAHNNPSATKVYHNVGFVGLCGQVRREGVERWLEIGFNPNKVVLGHW